MNCNRRLQKYTFDPLGGVSLHTETKAKVEFVIVLCKILYDGLLVSLHLHVIWSGFMFDSSFISTLFTVFCYFVFNTSFQNIAPSRQPLHE
jgi:hypothetical protein